MCSPKVTASHCLLVNFMMNHVYFITFIDELGNLRITLHFGISSYFLEILDNLFEEFHENLTKWFLLFINNFEKLLELKELHVHISG